MTTEPISSHGLVTVDGPCIVVGSPAKLPMRCVRTNLPVSESRMRTVRLRFSGEKDDRHFGSILIAWFVVNSLIEKYVLPRLLGPNNEVLEIPLLIVFWLPLILWLIYRDKAAIKTDCHLTYGVHPTLFRRANRWIVFSVITLTIVISGLVHLLSISIVPASSQISALPQPIVILLAFSALGLIAKWASFQVRLGIHRHIDGKFWINGCKPVFLESLKLPEGQAGLFASVKASDLNDADKLASAGRAITLVGCMAVFGLLFWTCVTVHATSVLLFSMVFFIIMMLAVAFTSGTQDRAGNHLMIASGSRAGFLVRLCLLIAVEVAIALVASPWLRP